MVERNTPPLWFWIAVALLTLWAIVGVGGFMADVMMTPAQWARQDAYDQRLHAIRPAWFVWDYGIATFSGLLGCVALLVRSRRARALFVVSLVSVVVMFGWALGATDLIAARGVMVAAALPVMIAAICVFELWLAGYAVRQGWIA